MRTLTLTEVEDVQGGITPGAVILGATALFITLIAISNWTSGPRCTTHKEPREVTYEVYTPVYDGYGNYMGDVVDIYAQTEWVDVTVCI